MKSNYKDNYQLISSKDKEILINYFHMNRIDQEKNGVSTTYVILTLTKECANIVVCAHNRDHTI